MEKICTDKGKQVIGYRGGWRGASERHQRIGAEFIALGMDFYSSITSFRSILCTRLPIVCRSVRRPFLSHRAREVGKYLCTTDSTVPVHIGQRRHFSHLISRDLFSASQQAEECYLGLVQAFFCCPFMFMLGHVNGSLNYNLLDL